MSMRNPSKRIVCCCKLFPFSPMGWPNGHFTKSARGTPTDSVRSLASVTVIVAIPARSIARAISPTDRLQRPQAGVRKAKSTPSDRSFDATSGAVRSFNIAN